MNNAKMWLVVKPTVGVPLFFVGVALTSLTVHTAVLNNTGWVKAFFQGKPLATASVTAPAGAVVGSVQDGTVVFNTKPTVVATSDLVPAK